jgi:hypothetical protein
MVTFWKILVWEKYGLRPGDRASAVVRLTDAYYLSFVLACLELGVSLVVTDKPVNNNFSAVRQRLYGNLKLAVMDQESWNDPVNQECSRLFFEHTVETTVFDTYEVQDNSLWESVGNQVFATKDTVAITTTTSGTTGVPTVIQHAHEWIYESSQRGARVFDFKKEDRILHARQLSHGAVLDLFLLPTLFKSDNHFVFNYDSHNIDVLIDIIVRERINKIMLFANPEEILEALPVLDHKLDIILGYRPNAKWISVVKQKRINSLFNSYGSTEAGNCILGVPITQETDPATFDPYYLGHLLDDYFGIVINGPDSVTITNNRFNCSVTLADCFELKSDGYYFYGRSHQFRIDDIMFTQPQLDSAVAQIVTGRYEAIVDEEEQKIYLAVYEPVADNTLELVNQTLANAINNKITVSKLAVVDYNAFTQGWKASKDLLRNYFKK